MHWRLSRSKLRRHSAIPPCVIQLHEEAGKFDIGLTASLRDGAEDSVLDAADRRSVEAVLHVWLGLAWQKCLSSWATGLELGGEYYGKTTVGPMSVGWRLPEVLRIQE